MKINIIGAGLSGLIAGATNPGTKLFERMAAPAQNHHALLRFRSDRIAKATGIAFRKVTVRKEVYGGATIRNANLYSMKVTGTYANRSIWNLDPVERFIAPHDLYDQLIEIIGPHRITWDYSVSPSQLAGWRADDIAIISTIPVPLLCEVISEEPPFITGFSPIYVSKFKVLGDCDVYQTIYFPMLDLAIYRATLTGNVLTIESTNTELDDRDLFTALDEFGLMYDQLQQVKSVQNHQQRFGKIAPAPDAARKNWIRYLTVKYGIYSLGRFAIWKNILLDDVYDDMQVIRKFLRDDEYDRHLNTTKEEPQL